MAKHGIIFMKKEGFFQWNRTCRISAQLRMRNACADAAKTTAPGFIYIAARTGQLTAAVLRRDRELFSKDRTNKTAATDVER